jgi:hypothetical protein
MAPEDIHRLRAAVGWLELENGAEALAELDTISEAAQQHPDVLETRWLALAKVQRWEAAVKVARAMIIADPKRPVAWLHHAYALRRAPGGGVLAAFNALKPVADHFPGEATIPYKLACYTCQMQRDARETMDWLAAAMKAGDAKTILKMALNDPDLLPLREQISRLKTKA